MNSEKFFTWCRVAVKGIKYRPDRDAVHKELYEHLEDRYESFRSRGWEHEAAIDKTIEAMGSAEELAPQLARIYRPFWPYMLVISRVVLIIAMVITVVPFGLFFWENCTEDTSFDWFYGKLPYDAYEDTMYQSRYQNSKRILYLEPECTARLDHYIITVTNAAYWLTEYDGEVAEKTFYFRVKAINQFPWIEPASNLVNYFWAEDSFGNVYYNNAYVLSNESKISGHYQRGGVFTYIFEMRLVNYISKDAEWIDLHYDRDGRDFVLRIDLTGGVKA